MPLGPPAAATKFQPPTPVSSWVDRSRLIDELVLESNKTLVLLHGPAGYGKSTLAAQWMAALAHQDVRVAWYSLDSDDNNTIWFVSHLLESLIRAGAAIDAQLLQLLEERPADAEKYVIPSIINTLAEQEQPVVVVLDDWHLITEHRTRSALARLLEEGPENLRFVVTSRTRNGIPLGRLGVREQLVEIDATSLRFDHQESRQWLVDIHRLDLSEDDIGELLVSTDGWAAALQLTGLSLKGQPDVSQVIRNISGRHQAIGDYLTENVLDTLEPEVFDFLLSTSVCERLCAGLASRLSGVRRGQAMLEDIQSRDLFLQPLDAEGAWFRYHHLFQEYLRKRLEREVPERVQGLHQKAAEWYAANNYTSEAVDHALLANDTDFAIQVVEEAARVLVEHSQMSSLLVLVRKIPEARTNARPRLQMAIAWATCLLHYPKKSLIALEHVERCLDSNSDLDDQERVELRIEALVVRRCLEMYADRITPQESLRAEVMNAPIPLRPWIVAVAANIVTYGELHAGRYTEAQVTQDSARSIHVQTTGPFSGVYGKCFAGLAALAQLEMQDAEAYWHDALELGQRSAGPNSHAARLASGLLGQLYCLRGEYAAAEVMLEEAAELGAHGGVVDFMSTTYSSLSRVRARRGDRVGAIAILETGEQIATDLSLPRMRARLVSERANLGFPWEAYEVDKSSDEHVIRETQASLDSAELSSLLRAGSPDAIKLAQKLLDQAIEQSNTFAALSARIDLAEAYYSAGQEASAKHEMRTALEQCYRANIPGMLHQRHQNCRAILSAIAAELESGQWGSSSLGDIAGFVKLVLRTELQYSKAGSTEQHQARVDADGHPSTSSSTVSVPKVSDREREILLLLERGLSNREIAESLYIGINTVKWHLKNIFAAFNVVSRQECVETAQRLRVLNSK